MKAGNVSSPSNLDSRLLRRLAMPTLLVDIEGVLAEANAAMLEMTGIERSWFLGKPLASMLEDPADRISNYLHDCARSEEPIAGKFTWHSAHGSPISIRCDGAALGDPGESSALILIVCRAPDKAANRCDSINRQNDELSRAIAEREKSQLQLEYALKTQDEFFSTAAHELRNPINALQLTLHTLGMAVSEGELPPAAQLSSRIARASTQVRRLSNLINHLLDVARMASGPIQLEKEKFDLVRLVGDAIGRSRENDRAPQIDLVSANSISIVSDKTRIEQVVGNLLSNAVRYGKGNPVVVRLSKEKSQVSIEVEDHGIGIAPEDQERIFERFERAANARTDSGFGLGLWIARRVVEALGGRVQMRSQLDSGSVFRIEFPV